MILGYHWIRSNILLILAAVLLVYIIKILYVKYRPERQCFIRKCSSLAFAIYLFLVAHITLLGRRPSAEPIWHFQLFWSYMAGSRELIAQNILNVIMFVPFGIFLYDLSPRPTTLRRVLVTALLSSLVIELVQLIGKLGEFEFDDILHNTAGALIGYTVAKWLCQKLDPKNKNIHR